ncbi:MAG: enoyl-CoA hydratase/isomerase family protein [Deltaproteobacteria bacterium]|nr:enoyl-CoA hydratase/isomerase family protein [Deltaproteobacteria bacterium]
MGKIQIERTHAGRAGKIIIDHPEKMNAMTVEMRQAYGRAVGELSDDPKVQVVVVQGAGNKAFSAGGDVAQFLKLAPHDLVAWGKEMETTEACPKPVIAAVNGHAIAGGCVLACTADHRIMARGTGRIGVPELLVGVPLPTLALEIMRFVTKSQQLQTMLYGGATYLPEDAVGLGLVDELVEPSDLLDRAVERAEMLANISPKVFEHTKSHIRQPVLERVRDGQASFETSVLDIWSAPETLEAIRNYVSQTLKK